jgi:recombination DNA repair RAD52 pathway protein
MTHTPPIFDPDRIKPLTNAQLWQLMQALPDHRVKELKGLSYVEAWDVKATLTRVFGFGGFSTEILSEQIMFEEQVPRSSGSGTNWSIGYKVSLRLIIPQLGAYWDEAAVGSNSQGSRAEATDNAVKGATSDALKRCATMLGTQFGLSLYDKGNQNEIIRTIVAPGQEWNKGARVIPSAEREALERITAGEGQRPASAGASVDHLKPEDVSAEKHEENKALLNSALSAAVAKQQSERRDARTQPESAEDVDWAAVAAAEQGAPAVLAGDRDE